MELATTQIMRGSDIMEKKFVVPEKEFTAEIFKPKIQTWVDITVTATSAEEAQSKILNLMSVDDIILTLKDNRGYLC